MIVVDARGLRCPEPVILTKKAMEKTPDSLILTLVDNEISAQNVSKLGNSKNYTVSMEQKLDLYYLHLMPASLQEKADSIGGSSFDFSDISKISSYCFEKENHESHEKKRKVFLLTKDRLGEGSEELGGNLMKTFLYALSETSELPSQIFLINGAVRMVGMDSAYLELLTILEEKGVLISSCGICLDYYGLKDSVQVGEITNMYTIVEALTTQSVVVL